ncbi:Distinct helicase family with a unique C-terminal domain including a metal-binding cysteine cluster [Rhodococcus rhodochrous J3]|uniref:Distinct helicase family with a unique C-terminal domain including a metal-binding cysteine cluster n=1 Tax=Rhodococcus rhodochrous J3 TaxID=903528 RepID=A0ABY1MGT1_RHORH|nr:DEAD/DEAH box helicase [Rhodococcus rhodochrous]SMG55763.1 Distinct helicase family with a unique C-terminal domain including a metal-binding cysteine cluster [Rhodococcus rhodochrous J3]
MGALLPTLQAEHLREGLTDYLATTFALTDSDAQGALTDFIGGPDTGMFKGPYVRLRLPFAPAGGNWGLHLDWWPTEPRRFTPYGHQARAFERLSTKFQDRPQPTMVTTGTGSGKTEAFLIPILDHVLRAKKAGVSGTKALILYPMNALANDQAERLAALITEHSELSGVTAGLYTGQQSSGGRTRVSEHGLITDRTLMRDAPPDILLTNYKMLDQLLLRPADAPLWRLSAESLQYIVLDEFHTYDGAQGTDVAMLLRRLGLTLKNHWTDTSTVTDTDRARPLGKLTPVATSATLGSRTDPTAMLGFAQTVFGEKFDEDAVIGETRITTEQWLADRRTDLDRLYRPVDPVVVDAVDRISKAAAADTPGRDTNVVIARAVLAELYERADDIDADRTLTGADLKVMSSGGEVLDLLKGHRLVATVLAQATEAISLADLATRVFPVPALERDARRVATAQQRFLEYLLALLSHVRAEVGRAALNVDVHLWIRELSRIDRVVHTTAGYRWSDDGDTEGDHELYLPAIFCRHCGRSGWGARLGPTGSALDVTDEAIRADHAAGASRFRALIAAPTEAQADRDVEGLRWFHIDHRDILDTAPEPDGADMLEGRVLPILTLTGSEADEKSTKDVCPACGIDDGIRFLGSAVATQLSVTLSNLFGDKNLDAGEKKALMFTDSVQDAAHRAGFVQARSHSLSLRSTLRGALSAGPLDLTELTQSVVARAGDDPIRRYQLLAPDIVDRDEFSPFWKTGAHHSSRRAAEKKAKRRLQFDIDLEFGLQSRTGRTLELTGSVVAEVYLGAPGRAATLGRLAAENTEHIQLKLTESFAPGEQRTMFDDPRGDQLSLGDTADPTILDREALARWVRGTVERIRTQGGIHHEWLRRYLEKNANRYHIWTRRPKGEGMPAFPKGRPAPTFPAYGSGSRSLPEGFDTITSPSSWYARWASRCLDVSPYDGTFLAKALFALLTEQRVLETVTTETGTIVYGLAPTTVQVSAPRLEDLENRKHLLVCDVCQTPVPGSATVVNEMDGAPCLLVRCPGTLHRAPRNENFYRNLYDSSEMKRVVAREHTSLLPTETRLEYETAFKKGGADPQAPNVLVATPTLEMGIDIGDLSTVMLGSLPRSVSSYLQRVGRAGRLTGNSLVLAYVRGRGEHLPKLFDPLSVIQGEVRPPATFLNAEEILQRQYVAHILDRFARDPLQVAPKDARSALGSFDEGSWMAGVIEHSHTHAAVLTTGFLDQFGGLLSKDAEAALLAWATPAENGDPSGLVQHLRHTVHRWNRDLTELTARKDAVEQQMPELERKSDSPTATDDDRRALRTAQGSRKLLAAQIRSITDEYWISVLEAYGVLPNYTLLDDSVTLDVGVSWIDPDSSAYMGDSMSYQRGSRIALTELAPGATFYAQGLAVKIDAVDLGTGESNIQTWQVCPQCGWVGISPAGTEPKLVPSCPRCRNTAISDVSQRLHVVEMERVSAEVRRDEATISDNRDDRHREPFTVAVAADIDPAHVGRAWFVQDRDFGTEYLRRLDIRWINLGKRASQGKKRIIAGEESATGLFRVCAACGQLDTAAGRNDPYEHRTWCRLRKADAEDVREIALARSLRTQGVLLHLPPELEYDTFAHPSLSAALLLGLRQVIGGSPEHLAVATISDALRAPDRRALLIHDTVPGGTGYLAEFADPEKVYAMLAAARKVVRECPCREEERLACHRCLLPFAPPHELDKVSRTTALKVLNHILDVGAHSEPDLDDWNAHITEEAPPVPPASDESFLEKDFYTAFIGRLQGMGAAVVEKPGTYGPSATITLQGKKVRRWSLVPQVLLGTVKPDFVLQTTDSSVRPIAIFADGRAFHASPSCNRVADDARKRAGLRESGYLVWSFGHEDLQRFKNNDEQTPSWFDENAAKVVTTNFHVRPALLRMLARDPVTQLLEFMVDPDIASWEALSRALPYLFVRRDNRAHSAAESMLESALAALNGSRPFTGSGTDMCWALTEGTLTVTAAVTSPADRSATAVLALDDRDEVLDNLDGRAWKEWLRLSNWLGIADRHRITTRSLLESSPTPVSTGVPQEQPLPYEWQSLLDETVSEAERILIRALVSADPRVPVPLLGYETDEGEVLDLAWEGHRIGVLLDESVTEATTMADTGWTLCPPEAAQIVAVLKTNGVL